MKKENTLGSKMRHPESFKLNFKMNFKRTDDMESSFGSKKKYFSSTSKKKSFLDGIKTSLFGAKKFKISEEGKPITFGEKKFKISEEGKPITFGEKKFKISEEGKSITSGEKKFGFNNRKFDSFDNQKFDKREQRKSIKESMRLNANEKRKQVQPTYEKAQLLDYSIPMRLNRFLANAGKCSRREADEFIKAGVVSVNGKIITELGTRVIPAEDKVLFHDEPVKIERRVYILLNKPKNCVTTLGDSHAKRTVLDIVRGACSERLYPVGRLDRNTTGVLLLTNDGELTAKLTHPSFNKKKVYQVTLDKDVTEEHVTKITTGITLEDGDIKVDDFSFIKDDDRRTVGVEIHSGRNRIVRRIFESLGYRVIRLDRVYFAGLTKKNLPRGKWRFLSEKEVVFLKMNANNPNDI